MDTEEVIWIVVAVAVVLALVALAWMLMRRKHEKDAVEKRQRAAELRSEADHRAQVLPDAELRAKEERVKAEALRLDAERAEVRAQEAETRFLQQSAGREDKLREADQIDPDTGRHKNT